MRDAIKIAIVLKSKRRIPYNNNSAYFNELMLLAKGLQPLVDDNRVKKYIIIIFFNLFMVYKKASPANITI